MLQKPPNPKRELVLMLSALILLFAYVTANKAYAFDWEEIYFKVGASYKVHENDTYYTDMNSLHAIGARFELGKCDNVSIGSVCYGVGHDSQWFVGPPFNDNSEYGKTEVFIDYKVQLKDLF